MSDLGEREADCGCCTIVDTVALRELQAAACGGCGCTDRLKSPEVVEAVARVMAGLGRDEDWPSNEALGGGLTGARDDEYRDGMLAEARDALAMARLCLLDAAPDARGEGS